MGKKIKNLTKQLQLIGKSKFKLSIKTKFKGILSRTFIKKEQVSSMGVFFKKYPFITIVILPWIITALYICFIKTPMYESTADVVIEKNDASDALMVNIGFLGKSGGDATNTHLLMNYITSADMLNYLDRELNVTQYFQNKAIDFLSRLKANSSNQEKLHYFHRKLHVTYDNLSGELTIASRAFDAESAKKMLEVVLIKARYFINKVANNLAEVQFVFATKQLQKAKKKLYLAEKNIIQFQNAHGVFDPKETIKVVNQVMAGLKAELVKKQTELINYSAIMRPTSSKILLLKENIAALKYQINQQTTALLGKKGAKLNTVLADFQWFELDLKYAMAEFEASQKAYDLANINLAKTQNLMIEISTPNLPDVANYPRVLYNLTTTFIFLLIGFILLKMMVIIIQEHID